LISIASESLSRNVTSDAKTHSDFRASSAMKKDFVDSSRVRSRLDRAFFEHDARVVARALIGVSIVHGDRVARIVETEAYRGPRDLACHARVGLTKRTRTLFGAPGTAYVFFIYGMHECFNVVCKEEGSGHAVLIRAAEIISGSDARADGPGRFARAMNLGRAYDGASLLEKKLFLSARPEGSRVSITTTARVGVAYAREWADAPLRFFDAKSASVSKPPKSAIGRNALKAKTTR
jgi:DNA-3-methyladenine glycosylase